MRLVKAATAAAVAVALRHYVVTKFIMETEATSLAAYQQFVYFLVAVPSLSLSLSHSPRFSVLFLWVFVFA